MMVVRFKTGVSPYQSGELAGFPDEEARCLIKAGLAEEYMPKKVKIEKEAEAEIEKEAEAEQAKALQTPPADKMVDVAPNKQIRKK